MCEEVDHFPHSFNYKHRYLNARYVQSWDKLLASSVSFTQLIHICPQRQLHFKLPDSPYLGEGCAFIFNLCLWRPEPSSQTYTCSGWQVLHSGDRHFATRHFIQTSAAACSEAETNLLWVCVGDLSTAHSGMCCFCTSKQISVCGFDSFF